MSYHRRKVLKALAAHGFTIVREGSRHTIVGKPDGPNEPIPRHNDLNRKTTRRIVRNLGLDWDAFEKDIS